MPWSKLFTPESRAHDAQRRRGTHETIRMKSKPPSLERLAATSDPDSTDPILRNRTHLNQTQAATFASSRFEIWACSIDLIVAAASFLKGRRFAFHANGFVRPATALSIMSARLRGKELRPRHRGSEGELVESLCWRNPARCGW